MNTRRNHESVAHTLITMRKSIGQLGSFGPLNRDRLEGNPAIGLVVERILTVLDDLAFEINSTVSAATTGRSPRTSVASFRAAQQAGLIDAELAERFSALQEPHHVLLQLCLDTEPGQAAAIASDAVCAYDEYVRQVERWTVALGCGTAR